MNKTQNTTVQTQYDEIDERELDYVSGGGLQSAQEYALVDAVIAVKAEPLPIMKL